MERAVNSCLRITAVFVLFFASITSVQATITPTGDGTYPYKYAASGFNIYFKSNTNLASPIRFEKDGYYFIYDISQGDILWAEQPSFPARTDTLGSGHSSNTLDTTISVSGDTATYANAFSDLVDAKYETDPQGMKETYVLRSLPAIKSYTYLQLSGKALFNSSLQICTESQCYIPSGTQDNFVTSGRIYFKDMNGVTKFYLKEPVITDSAGHNTTGIYKVYGSNAQMRFDLRIPTSFLSTATFPVYIDPSVYIPAIAASHLNSSREFISDIFSDISAQDGDWSEHINVGEYVRVTFNESIDSSMFISIYTRNNTDMTPLEVDCRYSAVCGIDDTADNCTNMVRGCNHANNPNAMWVEAYVAGSNDLIGTFPLIDHEGTYKLELTGLVGSYDTFDLKVVGASGGYLDFDYIVDDPLTVTITSSQNVVLTTTSHTFTATTDVNANCKIYYDSAFTDVEATGTSTAKTSCTSADDNAVGTLTWFISRTACQSYAGLTSPSVSTTPTAQTIHDETVKIRKADGTYGTTNKAVGGNWNADGTTTTTYGGSTDLWSLTWAAADINDVDFGLGFSQHQATGGISHYLKSTSFGFAITTGYRILGISISVTKTHASNYLSSGKTYGWNSATSNTVYWQQQQTSHSKAVTLGQGNHTGIYMRCYDGSGTQADSSGTYWLFVDSIAPTPTITSIGGDSSAPYATTDNTPTVLATTNENADCRASTDGDETYDGMSDDIDCTGDGGTSHTCQFSSAITPDGSYTFYVACKDTAGNKNTAANNAQAAATIDAVAPVITFTSIGGDGSAPYATADNTPDVVVSLDENSDCYASVTNDYSYDDMVSHSQTNCVGDGTTTATCTLGTQSDGSHTVYVSCQSTLGNKNSASDNNQVAFSVDTTAPSPSITSIGGDSSAPYATADTTPTVLASTDENADCYASVTNDYSYDDMVTNTQIDCSGDGTTSHTCQVATPITPDGSYTVYVSCKDTLGNKNTAGNNAQVGFTIDTTAPSPSITSIGGDNSPPYTTADTTPEVLASTDENADCRADTDDETYDQMSDDVDCSGDGTTSHTCQFGSVSYGIITFYVSCQDTLGNKNDASNNAEASATISNPSSPPSGIQVVVGNSGSFDPTVGSTTTVYVLVTASDADGWEHINLTNPNTKCVANHSGTSIDLASCSKVSNSSANEATFNCTGNFQYYHLSGIWDVNCTMYDNAGDHDSNDTESLTYDRLEAIDCTPTSITWSSILPNSTDISAVDDPITCLNKGNAAFSSLNVTGQNLIGQTKSEYVVIADDFSVNTIDSEGGNSLATNLPRAITGASLLIGAGSSEALYTYLEQVSTSCPEQTYSTSTPWTVLVFGAANTNP